MRWRLRSLFRKFTILPGIQESSKFIFFWCSLSNWLLRLVVVVIIIIVVIILLVVVVSTTSVVIIIVVLIIIIIIIIILIVIILIILVVITIVLILIIGLRRRNLCYRFSSTKGIFEEVWNFDIFNYWWRCWDWRWRSRGGGLYWIKT